MTWIDWERESRLVFDLKAGLEAALDEEGLNLEISQAGDVAGFNEANVKTNKLVFRAINHFELPILTTWYKYGQYEPHDDFTPMEITPQTLKHHDFPAEPSVPDRDYPSAKEFKYFFLECDLQKIVEQDLYKFLENNYREFAPDEYKQLYLANLQVLRIFDEIVSDEDLPSNALHYYEQLAKYSTRIRRELIANSTFDQEAEDIVVDYLRTVRNGLAGVAEKEHIKDDHLEFFKQAKEWYHEDVWTVPALLISIDKSEGVEESKFKKKGQKKLAETRVKAREDADDLLDGLFEQHLSPSSQGYKTIDDSISDSVKILERSGLAYNA